MYSFLFAFAWGLLIVISLVGWGFLLAKFLLPRFKLDFGLYSAFGLAGSSLFGGFLNLMHAISPKIILLYLFFGILLAVFYAFLEFRPRRQIQVFLEYLKTNKPVALLFFATILIVFFQYSLSVSPGKFNLADDYQAYLVFPQKMIQTGALGNDPFSERRLVSSLGGQSFLDTFILVKLPTKNIRLLDEGVGLLILIAVIWGLLKGFNVPYALRFILLLAVLFSPVPAINVTSLFVATVLFIALFRLFQLLENEQGFNWRRAAVTALLVAAICSLKSNFIVVAGVFVAGYYILIYWRQKFSKFIIIESAAAGILVFLLLLPWMISMYHSSGTLLYPLLGKGYYGSSYGSFPSPNSELFSLNGLARVIFNLRELLVPCTVALAFCYFAAKLHLKQNFSLVSVLVAASAIGASAIIYATGAADTYRYIYVYTIATFIILSAMAFNPENFSYFFSKIGLSYGMVAVVVLAVYFGGGFGKFLQTGYLKGFAAGLKFGITNSDITSVQEQQDYKNLQQAVPEGNTILARMDKNFLFDFKRNNIYIDDSPGGASLPPGMPFFQGSKPVADFLLSKNIRYVAYSYKNQANFTREIFGDRLSPSIHVWVRTLAMHYFDFQDNLVELSKTSKIIYDDGNNFVLDLSQRIN